MDSVNTGNPVNGSRDLTTSLETARRHTLEHYEKDLHIAQDLETRLGVVRRWEAGSPSGSRAGVNLCLCGGTSEHLTI